jgi:hypothetical protein
LFDGAAWEVARPIVCRTLAKSQNAGEEIGRLSNRLDHAFRSIAGNLPKNASVRIEQNGADEDLRGQPCAARWQNPRTRAKRLADCPTGWTTHSDGSPAICGRTHARELQPLGRQGTDRQGNGSVLISALSAHPLGFSACQDRHGGEQMRP